MPTLKPFGIGDLIVLKKRLERYQPGEIAHIENVMGKEHRKRNHRQLHQIETRRLEETEVEEESRHDLETTERFELENEIKQEVKTQEKFSAGLEVSGGFGPVQVSAYAKYDRDTSETESERAAQKYSKEITEKAMERIKERARTEREDIERIETEEINEHKFENDSPDHVVGVYRWVDKYYRVKPVNYGKRLFYEVVIPEPARMFLFARTWSLENRAIPEKPAEPRVPTFEIGGVEFWFDGSRLRTGDPGPLRPNQVLEANYGYLASMVGADGVKPPPAETVVVSYSLAKELDPSIDWILDGEAIPLPDDYEAVTGEYTAVIKAWKNHDFPAGATPYDAGWPAFCRIQIGQRAILQWREHAILGPPWEDRNFTLDLNRERGSLPISGTGNRVGTFALNINVICERTDEVYARWQMETYSAIMAAHRRRVMDYEDRLAASQVRGGVEIQGENPAKNLLTIKTELKRQFLDLWMNGDLELPVAVTDGDPSHTPPSLPDMIERNVLDNGEIIGFAEEAFDWDNLSFRLLPYFHGRKEKWIELSSYTDPDPVFENFLKAGAALVRLPVVPEYTHAVLYYQLTGRIWSRDAGEVPALRDVSAASEVELYNAYLQDVDPEVEETDVHREVEIRDDDPDTFVIKVPTSLVWLQQTEDLNPESE
ncbi:hypothetical protein EZI54_11355 [Marinobacter halodurans]|uniref:Uncharacterized protein n=1 Tax=Marinobacter halodurans TaxID=2528979 RepID=A0ABY1ZMJ4_9GAMM|nr:hypothetical protein [Marinobacter halodurans]TBW55758.1 hypothetical protein EZI54_11355 [Marinobacter halodurans]